MNTSPQQQSPRYLSTIFADDIRQEVGGKISIMGIYKSKMLVEKFPLELQRLAVLMSAVTSVTEPFSSLTFKVLKNDEVLQTFSIPMENLLDLQRKSLEEKDSRIVEVQFIALLKPFNLDGNTLFSTLIETETGAIRGHSIEICTEV